MGCNTKTQRNSDVSNGTEIKQKRALDSESESNLETGDSIAFNAPSIMKTIQAQTTSLQLGLGHLKVQVTG